MKNNGLKVLGALILLLLPLVGRWLWFHQGSSYTPPKIVELDNDKIKAQPMVYNPTVDKPTKGHGRVVIDLAHGNNLTVNDLTPLRDRIEARGVEVVTLTSDDTLSEKLLGATALVVMAPSKVYPLTERETIVKFIKDGGRLLMAADPTRPVPSEKKGTPVQPDLLSIFFPTSAIPAINSLAHLFEIVYFDDYLYNLSDNEGNYRNIKFKTLAKDNALTKDLSEVVFFSTHSLRGNGINLMQGDKNIHSSIRTGETDLTAAILAANEQVLALGDVTVLTPPYNTVADNDAFMSRLADWLAVDHRDRQLEDFPYLFTSKTVDMIQTNSEELDPRLVAHLGKLQAVFDEAEITVTLRNTIEVGHDAIYVGTFDQVESIKTYLDKAGITITMELTDTESLTKTNALTVPTKKAITATVTPEKPIIKATPTATKTTITATKTATTTTKKATPTKEATPKKKSTPEPEEQGTVEIKGIGTLNIAGTSLFLVDRSKGSVVVIALAEDGESVIDALDTLSKGDLSNCAKSENLIVCSTGKVQDGAGLDTSKKKDSETETKSKDKSTTSKEDKATDIFILSDDDGEEGSRTGAAEWEEILSADYSVKVWSTKKDGLPTDSDLAGFKIYIIDSGDYATSPDDVSTILALSATEGASGTIFIGAQPMPITSSDTKYAPLTDLKVNDATHLTADGFKDGQIITLLPQESDVPSVVIPKPTESYKDGTIVFSRGPESEEAGTPVVVAAADKESKSKIILATFPFYRLPDDVRATFGLNVVAWLLEEDTQ